MKISIAMCSYNGSKYIEEQLSSFLTQVRLPDELIICDDGSNDNTLDIIRPFASQAPFRTRIYYNNKLGSTKNFEKAIWFCSGDIIVLSDQDDVWDQHKLSIIEKIFMQNPKIGGIFSNAEIVDNKLIPFNYSLWDTVNFSNKKQRLFKKGKALDVLLNNLIVTGATLSFKSSLKEKFLPIPSCWMHDTWIALNIAVFSNFFIVHKKLVKYRQHESNQIGATQKGIIFRIIETLKMDRTEYYESELERYKVAFDHFRKMISKEHKVMNMIFLKIAHLKTRSHLSKNRVFRIPVILKELLKGNYNRYSASWKIAIRDMLIP